MLVGSLFADRDGGPYIGVGYGTSKYNDDSLYESVKSDTSGAFTIYGGAYINKYFSVELGYAGFNDYKIDDTTSVNFNSTTVSVLGHYAFFDDMLDFYAKGGVGNIGASGISADGFTITYGGGVGLRFTDWLGMKVAYDRYTFEYKSSSSGNHDMYIDFIYGALEFQF